MPYDCGVAIVTPAYALPIVTGSSGHLVSHQTCSISNSFVDIQLTWTVWCTESLLKEAHRHVSMLTTEPYSNFSGRRVSDTVQWSDVVTQVPGRHVSNQSQYSSDTGERIALHMRHLEKNYDTAEFSLLKQPAGH